MSLVLTSQAMTDTIGLAFTYFVLIPAILTGLIVVAVVTARGEKREDEKYTKSRRWGSKHGPSSGT
jgi:hypothetical protein